MKSSVEIFAELAIYLRQMPESVIEQAQRENSWFSHIDVAIDAICSKLLDRSALEKWLSSYPIAQHEPKRVGIVMAGNIPAVGFADLLYVIASGDIPYIKYSSKDRVLMEYIVRSLKQIEPELQIEQYSSDAAIDAVIATGSDSAALHFRSIFGAIPALIRGSRHSVAILSGNESSEDIEALSRDIFTHCGLGCRNVSLIFAPHNFYLSLRVPQMPQGYNNNYRHTRALFTLQGKSFTDCGGALTVESSAEFPRQISCINICCYTSIEDVKAWIAENRNRIQCVVAAQSTLSGAIAFGDAQYPGLNDYADDVDVMKFLLTLH